MPEGLLVRAGNAVNVTLGADRAAGEVFQTPDGRAAVIPAARASGLIASPQTKGVFTVAKTANLVMLAGQEIFWDHSANSATYWAIDDKDFFLGTVQKDAAGTDTTVRVRINERARCVFRADQDPARTVLVMTTAQGAAAGGILFLRAGGSYVAKFGTAAEAQKGDLMSVRSVPIASKWIWQAVGTVIADGDADVIDVVFGMADGTSATDPDAITTSAFFHLDLTGADLKIYAESDNAAAEVNATDTTKVWAAGTPFHLMIDGRSGDGSGLKYYVNGIRVLSGSAFTVAGATGPLKALFLIEKSSNDSPGSVALDDMKLWLSEDAAA